MSSAIPSPIPSNNPSTIPAHATCLCGSAKIIAKLTSKSIGACHCETCRRWGGGPYLSVDGGSDVEISGGSVATFNSSEWAERKFCSACGTHLAYVLKQNQQHFIPAGLFSGVEGLQFDHQVFIDGKPDYYCFANETEDMTGEQMFAKFAPPE